MKNVLTSNEREKLSSQMHKYSITGKAKITLKGYRSQRWKFFCKMCSQI